MLEYLWYLIRSTGTVAYLLLYASVLIGLYTQIRKKQHKSLIHTLHLHQSVSDWALILTGAHLVISIIDSYIPLTWYEALLPFLVDYEPIGMAAGIIAMYLLLITMITSYAKKKIGFHRWKKLHALNPILYIVATLHGLFIGTDTGAVFMIVINSLPLMFVIYLFIKKPQVHRTAL